MILLIISVIIATISGGFWIFTKKELDPIMKRLDDQYTACINNPFDLFRVIKVYRKSDQIVESEKCLFNQFFFCLLINYIAMIGFLVSWFFI